MGFRENSDYCKIRETRGDVVFKSLGTLEGIELSFDSYMRHPLISSEVAGVTAQDLYSNLDGYNKHIRVSSDNALVGSAMKWSRLHKMYLKLGLIDQ